MSTVDLIALRSDAQNARITGAKFVWKIVEAVRMWPKYSEFNKFM